MRRKRVETSEILIVCVFSFGNIVSRTTPTDTEADIKNLIERTEQATEEEDEEGKGGGFNFSFAKVWEAAKDDLIELPTEGGQSAETNDSWAATLAKLDEERLKAKAAELTGRGARRRNAQHVGTVRHEPPSSCGCRADHATQYGFDEGDARRKARAKGDSDFSASGDESASGTSSEGAREDDPAFKPRAGADWTPCGLCAQMHRPGDACSMMERSEHLAEYRFTLLTRSEHEPYEKRVRTKTHETTKG
jgi:chromodomain-helicase-DNA-binding protein 4